jgi:hypothetical protein
MPYWATPIGANTKFLQIDKRHTHFQRFIHSSHITNNLGSSGGKMFSAKSKMVALEN